MLKKQINILIQQVNQLEQLLLRQSTHAVPDEEPDQLSLSTSQQKLHKKLLGLKGEIDVLQQKMQQSDTELLSYKVTQLGNELEALARTIILQKQRPQKKFKAKASNPTKYQPDLTQPYQEEQKLKGYESKLEQQLNDLIDKGARRHQIDTARERLQRCRDALGLVQIHLQEKNK